MKIIMLNDYKAKLALSKVNKFLAEHGHADLITMAGGVRPIPFICDGEYYFIDWNDKPHKGKPPQMKRRF